LQSSSPAPLQPPSSADQNNDSSCIILGEENKDSSDQIFSDSSSDSGDSTASYETVVYPEHPACKEYHYSSGQHNYTHKNLDDIADDGLKYKSVVSQLELTGILDSAVGSMCGRLHWLYQFVKVFQDGGWHTVMLTDGCIDRHGRRLACLCCKLVATKSEHNL
jgi:hypothetical protein